MTSEAMRIGGVIFGVFFCLVAGTVVSGGFDSTPSVGPGQTIASALGWREWHGRVLPRDVPMRIVRSIGNLALSKRGDVQSFGSSRTRRNGNTLVDGGAAGDD